MKTKRITTCGMLAAMAYIMVLVCRIKLVPAADFLTYDPKDVIVAIAGFIFGPLYAFVITVVVSTIEMLTVSETGPIGLLMNVLATAAFALPASIIYNRKKTLKRAMIGLSVGVLAMTVTMVLWNYLITPLYQGVPREVIADMLLPIFVPFNVLKAGINMALTLMIYKPVIKGLRKAGLVEETKAENPAANGMFSTWILGLIILAACIGVVMILFVF